MLGVSDVGCNSCWVYQVSIEIGVYQMLGDVGCIRCSVYKALDDSDVGCIRRRNPNNIFAKWTKFPVS